MAVLSPKEKRFVSEYLVDQNATRAATRAGYSKKTAGVQGPRLLGKARVRAAVEAALVRVSAKAELTLEGHLSDLKQLRDSAEADGQHSAAVSAEVARGKASGLYIERVRVDANVTLEQLVLASIPEAK